MNTLKKALGWLCIAIVLGLGITVLAYPQAVNQIAGLAVAQSSTQWNRLKDFAQGDAFSNGVGAFSPCLFNGVTCDRQRGTIANGAQVDVTRLGGSSTPSDAFANPTTTNVLWVLNSLFNGTTWDRARSATADALASTGLTAAGNMVFNGSAWDRQRSSTGDGAAAIGIQNISQHAFNGSLFDRIRTASAITNTATTSIGVQLSTQISTWSVTNTPAVATAATASKAAGGGTVRHVATSVTVCVAANATAQVPILFHLRDGATGAGTIIRTWALSSPVTHSECNSLSALNMTGSANTAMTIESAAAPVAGSQATVTLTGYSTP